MQKKKSEETRTNNTRYRRDIILKEFTDYNEQVGK